MAASRCRCASAPASSPCATNSGTGPSSAWRQKCGRALASGRRALMAARWRRMNSATRPMAAGSSASMRSRKCAARAGEAPLVDMATATGPRRTTLGNIAVQSAGSSTVFTNTAWVSQASNTCRFTARSPVAAMTSSRPATSSSRNARSSTRMRRCAPSSRTAASSSGATTTTSAPVSTSAMILPVATVPAPTTRHGLPASLRNSGSGCSAVPSASATVMPRCRVRQGPGNVSRVTPPMYWRSAAGTATTPSPSW